jgi:hypothetical protein
VRGYLHLGHSVARHGGHRSGDEHRRHAGLAADMPWLWRRSSSWRLGTRCASRRADHRAAVGVARGLPTDRLGGEAFSMQHPLLRCRHYGHIERVSRLYAQDTQATENEAPAMARGLCDGGGIGGGDSLESIPAYFHPGDGPPGKSGASSKHSRQWHPHISPGATSRCPTTARHRRADEGEFNPLSLATLRPRITAAATGRRSPPGFAAYTPGASGPCHPSASYAQPGWCGGRSASQDCSWHRPCGRPLVGAYGAGDTPTGWPVPLLIQESPDVPRASRRCGWEVMLAPMTRPE